MMKTTLAIGVLLFASCALTHHDTPTRESYFLTEVKPVLQQQCLHCHNGTLPPPALNLASAATAFSRDSRGRSFIVPGDALNSLLITAIVRGGSHPRAMPLYPMSLTDDQIGMLQEWIEDGAYWPAGPQGRLRPQASGEIQDSRSLSPVRPL